MSLIDDQINNCIELISNIDDGHFTIYSEKIKDYVYSLVNMYSYDLPSIDYGISFICNAKRLQKEEC